MHNAATIDGIAFVFAFFKIVHLIVHKIGAAFHLPTMVDVLQCCYHMLFDTMVLSQKRWRSVQSTAFMLQTSNINNLHNCPCKGKNFNTYHFLKNKVYEKIKT
ncbi:hypothetical protein EIN_010840 [Entamoeba invadens IP1]|uniref:Uncharacterized protein n=1 Tax=Entamoeba invadens IP1 TaxID=370355 RepID=L7FP83_ENTIV|nr:hypothetical protein EIN_010840 [Entamoeba invadens IP1]ELP94558.1 hypothetical protein EIN_010840 [Entamoeba invadens IP1]|eukprot:XP_004261329.1 hypothetical protein EIN_010840 [Entamoeba invadens IP1]